MKSRRRLLRRGDLRIVAAIAATVAFAVMLNQPSSVPHVPTWNDSNLLRLNLPSTSAQRVVERRSIERSSIERPMIERSKMEQASMASHFAAALPLTQALPSDRMRTHAAKPLIPTKLPPHGGSVTPLPISKRLFLWGDPAELTSSERGSRMPRTTYAASGKLRIP